MWVSVAPVGAWNGDGRGMDVPLDDARARIRVLSVRELLNGGLADL